MIKINNLIMTGAMYAPFCRTKSAPMEEWDNDMKNMSLLGYTCVHGFAEWHDIEYEKGRFDFSKVDYFIECASKNNLVVIVNIATQNGVGFYSPRWLMEEYRNTHQGYLDSNGNTQMQSEYVIPCMDNPIYRAYAHRFLKKLAEHFKDDNRIAGYVLWGEPNIFSYSGGNGVICYCEHTKNKFRNWLKDKYKNIEALNSAWGNEGPTDYIDFCQVNPATYFARQTGGFNSWDDWREFMEWNLAGHIKDANRIFKENGALQPTITEMLPGINNGIDPWKLAETPDIIGISLFDRPSKLAGLYMTVSASIAKAQGKSTFVVEAAGGSVKFDNPNDPGSMAFTPSAEELKTTLLMRAGYGTKGVMYWCWRPRLSDMEGNDFGMCRPDGKPLKRTKELGEFAKTMLEFSPLYENVERKSDVAVFMSQNINHIMAGEMSLTYLNSLKGANFMLSDLHINSDFICEKEIIKGSLQKYKVLILPCSYIISEECAEKIAEFVHGGGCVIADYILAEKRPGGVCYTELPGAGFDKVFGIEREDVFCISHETLIKNNTYGIKKGCIIEELILNTAVSMDEEYVPGCYLKTKNTYGSGYAYYIPTQYFYNYFTNPDREVRKHLMDILISYGVNPYLKSEIEDNKDNSTILTSALYDESGKVKIITVTNTDYYPVTDVVSFDFNDFDFIKKPSTYEINKDDNSLKYTLGALESFAVYKK